MAAPLSEAVSRTKLLMLIGDPLTLVKFMFVSEDWAVVARVGELGPTVKVSVPHGDVAPLFWPLLEVNTACH